MNRAAQPLWPTATLVTLTGLNLLDYLDRNLLAAVVAPLKAELHFTDAQLGMLPSAFMLGYFLTAPVFGWLGDRWPRRWLVAGGVFVWSLGTLLTGHASAFAMLLLFRVLVGFGEASFGTISPGWIADLFGPGRRNNAISFFYLAIPVGSALGYVIGASVAAHWGWRAAFLWAGYPGLALAAALWWLREPSRGAAEAEGAAAADPGRGLQAFRDLVRRPRYVLVVAGYTAQTFALGGFAFWGPSFLHREHGMEVAAAGQFFGLALVVMGLLATLLGGWTATRWQRRHPAGYARMLAGSAWLAVPVSFAVFLLPDPGASRLALAAAMFLLFLPTGPINTLILETVPVAQRATAMAASIFAIHAGGDLWSSWIVGRISDATGSLRQAALPLPFALLVAALCWTGLAVAMRRPAVSPAP